jgi:hypothetical protein
MSRRRSFGCEQSLPLMQNQEVLKVLKEKCYQVMKGWRQQLV